jgi:predicted nucleic acid-binding protein
MTALRPLVVDASVVLKLLIVEDFSEHAHALLRAYIAQPIVGPPVLAAEVTNAIYQRLRRQRDRLTTEEGERALADFLRLGVELLSPAGLYPQAFAFARRHRLSNIYDALYVVLAQMLGTELWTDDQALLNALGPSAPWVRSIRTYPLP